MKSPALVLAAWLSFVPLAASASGIVAIDAGHGGFEHGIEYVREGNKAVYEKDITFSLARLLAQELRKMNAEPSLVRETDLHMGIPQRAAHAEAIRASSLISLHVASGNWFNIYVSSRREGGGNDEELAKYLPYGRQAPFAAESKRLAASVAESIKRAFPDSKVNHIEMPLPLLDETGAPAVMVETPHPSAVDYESPETRQRLAKALAEGVLQFTIHGAQSQESSGKDRQ